MNHPFLRQLAVVFTALSWAHFATGCTHRAPLPHRPEVAVIAHRGASAYAPENTLAAFRLAAQQGADWFELDCRLTQDGEIVVMHDDDLERTTGAAGTVTETSLATIRTLDAGRWFGAQFAGEPVPTLNEALELARDHDIGVYVEIKSCDDDWPLIDALTQLAGDSTVMTPGLRRAMRRVIYESGSRNVTLTRKTIHQLRAHNMRWHAVIQSFSPIICFVARDLAPEYRTEFLGAKDDEHPERWELYRHFGYLIGVDGFNPGKDSLDRAQLAAFQRSKKRVAVWTVNDETDMRRFADWGVDAIITNHPDTCLHVLESAGRR